MTEPGQPKERVAPVLAKGMQDLPAATALARERLIAQVRRAYESHGFAPLATPALEDLTVLLGAGGTEANRQVFRVDAGDGDPLGLRFDLTVPLARHVAARARELPRPFRRYQVGPVYRVDKPGPGRFREFIQFDADIVGTRNPLADADIISALRDVFESVVPADGRGPRYCIRMSDRRILDALLDVCGLPAERAPDVLRVLDKLDRIGRDKVALELGPGYVDESGDRIAGVQLDPSQVQRILEFLDIQADTRRDVLAGLAKFLHHAPSAAAALAGVTQFCDYLDAYGVSDGIAKLDVSIARGLAYYTGPVFEVVLRDAPACGAVAAGGRYDSLVERFLAEPWPGVGVSVGIDRLLVALETAEEASAPDPGVDVLVTVMDRARVPEFIAIARELRTAGLRTEIFVGDSGGFGKQLKHADRRGTPVAVIAGADELARGTVQVKALLVAPDGAAAGGAAADDASRADYLAARFGQREVARAELVATVREALASMAERR